MFARTTRLELIIVVTALLLLWFCSRPPTSGNAQTFLDTAETAHQTPLPGQPADSGNTAAAPASVSPAESGTVAAAPTNPEPATPPAPPQPRYRRIGIVDARNCDKLNYQNVMYGEIAVRSVWDGQRFVPRKVCVVRESDGTSSVWTFDEQDNIKLSEIQEPIEPTP
jgi:hypothetical protein